MNLFFVIVPILLLVLSFASNYVYVWLFGVKNIHTVTAALSIAYVVIAIAISALGRSTSAIAPLAVQISGIVLGAGYYLLICSIIGMAVYTILSAIKFAPPRHMFAVGLLVAVAIMTIAGFIYAQTLTVRNYKIQLSDTPTKSQTIALIADTHFGPPRNTKLANRLVSKLQALSPDIILYAGDMYDGPAFDFNTINPAMRTMSTIAPVYFSPGNHEGYGPYSDFITNNTELGFINLLDTATTQSGLTILGLNYRTNNTSDELQPLIDTLKSNNPKLFNQPVIAIHHSPIILDTLARNGVDLSVHGHTHRGQFWPNGLITRMVYGKYFYGHKMFDAMHTVTTSGVGTAGPAMRLFNTPEIVIITVNY